VRSRAMQPKNLRDLLRAHMDLPCPYCGQPMERPTSNHVRPVIYGGSLTEANKLICCAKCDHDKEQLTLTTWAARLRAAGDPRLPIVVALRAARKAAKALLAA
jgi:5-methylcytosine-specific restriction endonuclease McrA